MVFLIALNLSIMKVSIILLLLGGIVLTFVKKLKKLFSKDKKSFLIYLLVSLILFGLTGVLSIERVTGGEVLESYITIQVVFFILGILHLIAMDKFMAFEDENKETTRFLFTLVIMIVGSIAFLQVSERFGMHGLHYYLWSGILLFVTPHLFMLLFNTAIKIPFPVYLKWYYPINKDFSSPSHDELRDPMVISLEFKKNLKTNSISKFKVKAPENMSFSRFFYHFINDYNLRHPESPIDYRFKNQPHGWVFYFKPNFLGMTSHINPELTIVGNKIRENHVIVCERINE